jgi:hypothetical protein
VIKSLYFWILLIISINFQPQFPKTFWTLLNLLFLTLNLKFFNSKFSHFQNIHLLFYNFHSSFTPFNQIIIICYFSLRFLHFIFPFLNLITFSLNFHSLFHSLLLFSLNFFTNLLSILSIFQPNIFLHLNPILIILFIKLINNLFLSIFFIIFLFLQYYLSTNPNFPIAPF